MNEVSKVFLATNSDYKYTDVSVCVCVCSYGGNLLIRENSNAITVKDLDASKLMPRSFY